MRLRDDTTGASSVIGVVLLVAITVLVAATVGVVVFAEGEGATDEPPPESAFEFEYAQDGDTREAVPSDNLTVTYTHGTPVPAGRLNFSLTGAREFDQFGDPEGTDDLYITEELFGTGRIGAGDTAVISEDNVRSRSGGPLGSLRALDLREATVRITWTGPNGERSFVIATFEGPAV